jgi:hypothetical protein
VFGYFALAIHTGIRLETSIIKYERTNAEFRVCRYVHEIIGQQRFQEIDRFLYVCLDLGEDDPPFTRRNVQNTIAQYTEIHHQTIGPIK